MEVINDYVGSVLISDHALARYAERGGPDGLPAVLKAAHPFGGQYGKDVLLANGDVVFVTKKKGAGRVVITVLTRDMAIANMETFQKVVVKNGAAEGGAAANANAAETPAAPFAGGLVGVGPPPPAQKSNRHVNWFNELTRIYGATDAELAAMLADASGAFIGIIQRELGQRVRLARQAEHAKRMDLNRRAVIQALRRLVPEAEHANAYKVIEEEERAMGLRTD